MAEVVAMVNKSKQTSQAQLSWLDKTRAQKSAPVKDMGTTIGSGLGCDVVLEGGFPGVRKFATITPEKGVYWLEPLSRMVGVQVNGYPIRSKKLLADGDILEIAGQTMNFRTSL
jgi:hypothetical protein